MIGHELKLYNLPQRVEGGIKIHGFSSPAVDTPDDVVVLFDHLDGMWANCTIEGDKGEDPTIVHLHATTPLLEQEDGSYKINGEPEIHEDDGKPGSEEE